jgi:carbohydrate kinase (thermoresistant glucokinase family)
MTSSPHPLPGVSAMILMGVSGSGKSTIGAALAERIGFAFEDGDAYHPDANVAKMHAGIPLTDDDRRPWLKAIAAAIDRKAAARAPVIIACSALKRAYRDILVHGRDDVRIVYLKGTQALIAKRLARRDNHFMPSSLLDSQFATLEEPADDEGVITVSIDGTVDDIVDAIVVRLDSSIEEAKAS